MAFPIQGAVTQKNSEMAELDARTQVLSRIAAMLGCSVEAFSVDGDQHPDLSGPHELLALWGALKSDESRVAVLKLVRTVVEAEES